MGSTEFESEFNVANETTHQLKTHIQKAFEDVIAIFANDKQQIENDTCWFEAYATNKLMELGLL